MRLFCVYLLFSPLLLPASELLTYPLLPVYSMWFDHRASVETSTIDPFVQYDSFIIHTFLNHLPEVPNLFPIIVYEIFDSLT